MQKEFLGSPEQRKAFGDAARVEYTENYTPSQRVKKILAGSEAW